MPFEKERQAIRSNRLFLLVGLTGLTVIVILILVFFERILVFKPVKAIKEFTEQIKHKEFNQEIELTGDEFEEFESICMLIDEKLKNQHQKLENKIGEATRDLARTNQKLEQANKELLAFNKAKIDFFSDISHEFRTPLTSVKGAADILIRKNLCQDNSYVEIIKKNTERLIRTTVDLIDYSKIEADRLELDKQKESLNTVAMQVIETQKTIAQQKGINLVLDSPDDFVLMFDEHRIFQVITNLVANAIRFSPTKGTITISINSSKSSTGPEVAVSVQDQGPGILEEYRESIFNKFYQIPQPGDKSNKNIGSSGIGLAICKGLVKAHGGKIWVEGAEKQGSRFIFTLPS
jgi:signal transduction histidine kinase